MSQKEPDYASLPSHLGQASEDGRHGTLQGDPHPFWSERLQDEFRLQQRRPRELDMVTLEENAGEVLLGMEAASPLEPPYYGTESSRSQLHKEELVREAVEDIPAENESLRRKVSEMEAFSSVVSSVSRGRRVASSAGQSAEMPAMEPEYGRMFEMQQASMPSPQEATGSNEETETTELTRPVGTMTSIMQRAGSLERWQALRSFLGFPTAGGLSQAGDQDEGRPTIQGDQNVGSVFGLDRTSRELFAAPRQQAQDQPLIRSDRPGGVCWTSFRPTRPSQL